MMVMTARHWIELSVSDTGKGMTSGPQMKLFEEFSQADAIAFRRHETRPCPPAQACAHDGRRCDSGKRTQQGLGIYCAPTWQRRQLTKGQNAWRRTVSLLQCICRFLALLGPREMSDLSPQSEAKRTLIRSLSPIAISYPRARTSMRGFQTRSSKRDIGHIEQTSLPLDGFSLIALSF